MSTAVGIDSIAYFVWSPLTMRDYQRLGIDTFRDRFHVRVFDCTPWLAPAGGSVRGSAEIAWFPGYQSVESPAMLLQELDRCVFGENWAAFDHLGPCAGANWVRRLIKARKARRMECALGNLPVAPSYYGAAIFRIWSMRQRIFGTLVSRLFRWWIGAPEIAIVAGRKAALRYGDGTRVIKAHSMDFETARAIGLGCPVPQRRYAVYLDEDMVSHPDYDHLGIIPATTAERFFPALNRFFGEIERVTGMPVVVAAHPKSSYGPQPGPFGNREVIAGRTAELVRGASLVLAHASTSVSFAVIWQKPVVTLTSDDIDRHPSIGGRVWAFAESLRSPIVNIDHPGAAGLLGQIPECDGRAYDAYCRDYLKEDGTSDRPLWSLVADELSAAAAVFLKG